MSGMIHFKVEGSPTGKGRHRTNLQTGRTYTPAKTASAEERVRAAWREAGSPSLEGSLEMQVCATMQRPKGHYLKDGQTLSTEGLRHPWPIKKPDLDNVLKLVADALNQCAYRDDSQVVMARLIRRWAKADEFEHVEVVIKKMPLPLFAVEMAA